MIGIWTINKCVSVGKIFATMLSDVAASIVSFNLICNMTSFRKIYSLTFSPTPWVKGVSVGKIFATMLLPASSALI